jgi:hypothetical protein
VSVAIFAVFTCTTFESGNSYLDADARIMCYDTVHKRYMGGAAVWLVLVPFGVPAFFLWLLHRFKVPQMAALLSDNAWLREAIKLAWAEGMAQPADAASLTVDSITTLHLEALFAFFLHDMSAEDAAEIIAGTRPPLQDTAADAKEDPERASSRSFDAAAVARRVSGALRKVAGRVNSGVSRRIVLINSVAAKVTGDDAAAARRQLLLTSLLTFLRSSGDAAVPPLTWERPLEEEVAALKQICPDAVCAHSSGLRCADVPQLMDTAMAEVAFLFAAYRMDCWYWCVPHAPADPPFCVHTCATRSQGGGGAHPKAAAHLHPCAHRSRERGPSRGRHSHRIHRAPCRAHQGAICAAAAQPCGPGCAAEPVFPALCRLAAQGTLAAFRASRARP